MEYSIDTFDWKFYVDQNSDLREAGIITKEKAWGHWCKYGCNENRRHRKNIIINKKENKINKKENKINKKENKKILVALPTYNRSEKIKDIIKQFSNQTIQDYLLFIIDDGSDNHHKEIIEKTVNNNNNKIKLIRNEKNLHIAKSLNKAIEYFLKNEFSYFTWISDDNIYDPKFLELLRNNTSDFCYSNYTLKNEITDEVVENTRSYNNVNELLKNFNGCASFMWSKNAIKNIGFYTENINGCEDYDYLVRTFMTVQNKNHINHSLMTYVRHKDALFTKDKNNILLLKEKLNKLYESLQNEKKLIYNHKLNVFIINLDTEEEKLKTSIAQFPTDLFNINRFNAIKGIDIKKLNSDQSIIDMDISKYTNGQVGCLMSHLSLIKMFYEDLNDDYILIVEDDILDFNLHNFNIFQIIDKAPENWHTIRLSYVCDLCLLDEIIYKNNDLYTNTHNLWVMGTGAYLISRKGCKYIYENFFKNNKWCISNFLKRVEYKTRDDRFAIDKWLYSSANNYYFKYIYYGYTKNSSQTCNNINEIMYQNNSLDRLVENNKKIKLFNPDVSIILPTYNGLKTLQKSIDSILNQTYKNFELIIIIDGSTDGTHEYLIDKYSNNKQIHITFQKNMKLPSALNEGLKRCRGKFITWTSDDNQLRENMIMKLRDFLIKNKEINFVYSGVNFYGSANWELNYRQTNIGLFFNYPGLASFMWTKEAIKNIGFYDASLNGIEDYDYILRTIEMYPNIGFVDEILYDYYFDNSGTNMTSEITRNNKLKELNTKLLNALFLRNNNNLPNFNILFPNSNLTYKEKCDKLHSSIINCRKDGYLEFFKNNNTLKLLKNYSY